MDPGVIALVTLVIAGIGLAFTRLRRIPPQVEQRADARA